MADSPYGGVGTALAERPNVDDLEVRAAIFQEGYLDLKCLVTTDGPPDIEQLKSLAEVVSSTSRNSRFWYGDFLIFAEENYGESYAQFVDSLGHTSGEIADMRWVSRSFPSGERFIAHDDRPGLTWTHHKVCASFYKENPVKCRKLMTRALDEGWPVRVLRMELNKLQAIEVEGAPKSDEDETETVAQPQPETRAKNTTFHLAIVVRAEDADTTTAALPAVQRAAVEELSGAGITPVKVSYSALGTF